MSFSGDKLFNLLPALYRLRDAQLAQKMGLSKGPLQDLMGVVGEQLMALEEDLDQLYDDQFIETCAPWVIPYIGDLIGYQSITGAAEGAASSRAEVAHTISFRRRKGTVLVLEQLARDVTGWGAHAVEFFLLLADTEYMKHVRLGNHACANLRKWQPREYMDTGFDATTHKVDVRRIAVERGRSNIQNVGIFLWSLNAYGLTAVPSAPSAGSELCYRFNPLGADLPLFNLPISQGENITAPAKPENVANVLSRHVLCRDIQTGAGATYYGPANSVALFVGGSMVDPYQIRVCDLSGPEGAWANLLAADSPYSAAVDPELGRIALRPAAGSSPPAEVSASFHYGFNADMGGGQYPRSSSFTAGAEQTVIRVPGDFVGIQDALDALGGDGVVEVTDSGTYAEPSGLSVAVKPGGHIELRASDGSRPVVILGAELLVTGGADGAIDLNGLVLSAPEAGAAVALVRAPATADNQLVHLGITHCTLVPGWALAPDGKPAQPDLPALVVEASGLALVVQSSVVGAIRSSELVTVALADSLLDATAPTEVAYAAASGTAGGGGPLTLTGCTVVGKVHATLFTLVSNSLIWAALSASDLLSSPPSEWSSPFWTDRKQEGCVRFSFVPIGAVLPRHFKCVQQAPAGIGPRFVSLRYGAPGYGKLYPVTDDSIRRGADDGGEMGAFHFLLAPLRETDLRTRMQEYLPVGLEYGIFYET